MVDFALKIAPLVTVTLSAWPHRGGGPWHVSAIVPTPMGLLWRTSKLEMAMPGSEDGTWHAVVRRACRRAYTV